MLNCMFLIEAALNAFSLHFVAELSAAVVRTAFLFVPAVFIVSLVVGLGTRNWGRCL